jgi:hypothetical protein
VSEKLEYLFYMRGERREETARKREERGERRQRGRERREREHSKEFKTGLISCFLSPSLPRL